MVNNAVRISLGYQDDMWNAPLLTTCIVCNSSYSADIQTVDLCRMLIDLLIRLHKSVDKWITCGQRIKFNQQSSKFALTVRSLYLWKKCTAQCRSENSNAAMQICSQSLIPALDMQVNQQLVHSTLLTHESISCGRAVQLPSVLQPTLTG